MTLTERAWELFLGGIQGTHAIKISDAFELAKAFEEEAAKHEAPKTEGEVRYAVAWLNKGKMFLGDDTHPREKAERKAEFPRRSSEGDVTDEDTFDEFFRKRNERLDVYTAAFIKEVGSKEASKYTLCEIREGTTIRWEFKLKEKI